MVRSHARPPFTFESPKTLSGLFCCHARNQVRREQSVGCERVFDLEAPPRTWRRRCGAWASTPSLFGLSTRRVGETSWSWTSVIARRRRLRPETRAAGLLRRPPGPAMGHRLRAGFPPSVLRAFWLAVHNHRVGDGTPACPADHGPPLTRPMAQTLGNQEARHRNAYAAVALWTPRAARRARRDRVDRRRNCVHIAASCRSTSKFLQ